MIDNEQISAEESLGISSEEYNRIVDECLFETEKSTNENLVMLTELEKKVARVLTPGIDTSCPWTPAGRDLVRKSIKELKEIFREYNIK